LFDVLLVFTAPSTPTQEAHKHTEILCLFYVHVKHSVPENKTEIVKFNWDLKDSIAENMKGNV
jgi:hypothetical protein